MVFPLLNLGNAVMLLIRQQEKMMQVLEAT